MQDPPDSCRREAREYASRPSQSVVNVFLLNTRIERFSHASPSGLLAVFDCSVSGPQVRARRAAGD